MKTRPMTAWLIMWEWIGDHAAVEKPYLDIVSGRRSVDYVKDYVQRLHDLHCLTLRERIPAARYNRPSAPIYEAQVARTRTGVEIHCGHNPHLTAKLVRDLTVETDPETWIETVSWAPYLPHSN